MKSGGVVLPTPLVAVCCMAQDVRYNFVSGQDFSKYRTHNRVQITGSDKLNSLAQQQLQAAVDAELIKKDPVNSKRTEPTGTHVVRLLRRNA